MSQSKEIKHLFLRAGFGISPQERIQLSNRSRSEVLADFFKKRSKKELLAEAVPLPETQGMMSQMVRKQRRQDEQKLVARQNIDWLNRMGSARENALLERMTLFWHGHFACEIKFGYLAAQYLDALRTHALGNFRDLAVAVAKTPAMLRYLNNQQNRKHQPNENFARELMELFTIGRGNYSEKDIKESARAFTGWSGNRRGEFAFKEHQHDFEEKDFMGKKGNFTGEDIIDMLLEKRQTAVFLTRKIYRYFVNEKANEGLIADLAEEFYNSNYDIEKLMRRIFESDWFYAPENIGTKIKSPVELIAGLKRTLNFDVEKNKGMIFLQKGLGQILFKPPNVAGWAGGKTWIDNSTLNLRLNLSNAVLLAQSEKTGAFPGFNRFKKQGFSFDFQPIIQMVEGKNEEETIRSLADYFLQNSDNLEVETIRRFAFAEDRSDFVKKVCVRLLSLPEYQMC